MWCWGGGAAGAGWWWVVGRGLFSSSSGCQKDHSDLLLFHWQSSWSQSRLFNQCLQRTAGGVITITSLVFFSKENHIKRGILYVPRRKCTRVSWWKTPRQYRADSDFGLLQTLTCRKCKGFSTWSVTVTGKSEGIGGQRNLKSWNGGRFDIQFYREIKKGCVEKVKDKMMCFCGVS